MSHQHKKAVSEIVSYAILIVISLSLAASVYYFLQAYIPKEKIECNEDISISASGLACNLSNSLLALKFSNNGFFKIDAVYVRFGKIGEKAKQLINKNQTSIEINASDSASSAYKIPQNLLNSPDNKYEIEIEPAIMKEGQIVLCNKAIITEQVVCV